MEVVIYKEINRIKFGIFNRLQGYNELIVGFSTRHGGVSLPPYDSLNLRLNSSDSKANILKNRSIFFSATKIPLDNIAYTKQTHSSNVKIVSEPGLFSDTDALITKNKGLFLVISFADCLPIFLYEPVQGVVAVVHSGWRGTKNQIVTKTIEKMKNELNAAPEKIIAGIGPSIGDCCYEVKNDVAKYFDQEFLKVNGEKSLKLNLWKAVEDQLSKSGVKEIINPEICTMCHPELYFSYRRDKKNAGGMLGVISLITGV